MDQRRRQIYNSSSPRSTGPILYWLHRDLRARHNWGLIHARQEALRRRTAVAAVFCLDPAFPGATLRSYDFLLAGLEETAETLRQENIPLILLTGDPPGEVDTLCRQVQPALVVTDFDPLHVKRHWLQSLVNMGWPIHEVDSRNIVPCWLASPQNEYAARTFRPKIHRQLPTFLRHFPELSPHPHSWSGLPPGKAFTELRAALPVDNTVQPVTWLQPGESAAWQMLDRFLAEKLSKYPRRNDPTLDATSKLSPYLHFGMISAQAIMLTIRERRLQGEEIDAFTEELIVRRELSDNFCLYTPDYDQVSSFPIWARQSLELHLRDRRPYLYNDEEFEQGLTHDALWNAAQRQMVSTGRMPGYLRMYWAKKILEWSKEPSRALRLAIRLNDRYALDGRDSNGYAGIAWSIGGVHDRAWPERPIFGKVRYMNEAGARRKFDVERYCQTWIPRQANLFQDRPKRDN